MILLEVNSGDMGDLGSATATRLDQKPGSEDDASDMPWNRRSRAVLDRCFYHCTAASGELSPPKSKIDSKKYSFNTNFIHLPSQKVEYEK